MKQWGGGGGRHRYDYDALERAKERHVGFAGPHRTAPMAASRQIAHPTQHERTS